MKLIKEIEKSFLIIQKLFTYEELLIFKNRTKEELYLYHFGIGIWIRNHLLSNENKLYKIFFENGITQKDDMSAILIEMFHQSLL